MSANRKKVLVPDTLGPAGLAILSPREDLEVVLYPPGLAKPELHALLRDAAGIGLSFTRFGEAEVAAAPVLQVVARIGVGYDAVEIPPLTARGIPLMIAGTANSTSVAEHALFFMLALAKRAAEMDRRVRGGLWHERRARFSDGGLRQGRAHRRVRAHWHAHRFALPRAGTRCAGVRPLCPGGRDPRGGARAGRRSGRRPAARRFGQHPLPQIACNHRPVRRRPARAHEGRGFPDQHRPRRHRRRGGAVQRAGVRPSGRRRARRVRHRAAAEVEQAVFARYRDPRAAHGRRDRGGGRGDGGGGGAQPAERARRPAGPRERGQPGGSGAERPLGSPGKLPLAPAGQPDAGRDGGRAAIAAPTAAGPVGLSACLPRRCAPNP